MNDPSYASATNSTSNIGALAQSPALIALRERLQRSVSAVLDEAIAIQQIPAPTFEENARAEYVQRRFTQLGLLNIEVDSLYNVYGRLPGSNATQSALLIAAHTDTVFERNTALEVVRRDGRVYGPGLGDNSLGVAAVLALVAALREEHLPVDVWFVANSREEGMGNLGGIQAVHNKLGSCLGSAIIVEGMAYGHIYHAGIRVRRLEISCQTGGGHSWLHFGRPSAIHHLMRVGAAIAGMQVPNSPRTTYNIGMISGGQSVNSIAANASLLLDLRSTSPEMVEILEREVAGIVEAAQAPGVTFEIKVVGDRPSGEIPVTHPLVQLARDALQLLGTQAFFERGSTDANALLAANLPTITLGVTRGGNAHRLDEYIEGEHIGNGLFQLALVAVAAASGLAS
ncbi:MAG TPA: M20/M25/M40 family metallo-hydrolase [Aggregatilineales bacterium]|nr:M20/M25/M40 family metallo-hydrolase [Aggregatilineales bacterium]